MFTRIIRSFLMLVLVVSLVGHGTSWAVSDPSMDPVKKTELVLKATAFAISMYPSFADLIATLPSHVDRDYFRKQIAGTKTEPIHVKYLERNTLLFWSGNDQLPVEFKDLVKGQISIFKHDFFFKPNESAESAIKRLHNTLASTDRKRLLLPTANALPWPLLSVSGERLLMWLYFTAVTTFMVTCSTQGWNSVKTCFLDGPGQVDNMAMVASLGLVLMAVNSSDRYLRGKLADKTFDLEDLTCKSKDQPLRAKVTDSAKATTMIELAYNGETPDHLDFKHDDKLVASIYLKPDGSPAPERLPEKVPTFDADVAEIISQAAWSLNKFCADGDSTAALKRYRQMRDEKYSMRVTPDTGTDQPTATVK